jgi:alpha-tubulin suppressor-like RCC1 family protein
MNTKRRQFLLNITLIFFLGLSSGLNAQTFAAGFNHSVFSCTSGIPQSVGTNTSGQLALGTWQSNSHTPIQAMGLDGVITVEAGYSHSLFLKYDGTVWGVGSNSSGQLGDGTTTIKLSPVQVLGLTGITAISASMDFSVFLKNDGTVWAVGNNHGGQLGDGTNEDRSTPVQVLGLTGIVAISAGLYHTLYLKNDGTVWATGGNYYGQIGNQSLSGVSTPAQVIGLTNIIAISAGGTHSLFLKSNHTVWGVGSNFFGQLGNANVTHYIYEPFQIGGLSGITKLSAGYLFSLFLKNNGTVWAVGTNTYGQLGDGTTVDKSIPFAIPGLTNTIAINAGVHFSLFLKNDGTIRATGNNNSGQLGDGTTIERHTPVLVNNVCANNLSTAENAIKNAVAIYPNPCNGQFFIAITNPELEDAGTVAELYTMQGQLLRRTVLKTATTAMPVDDLMAGIYFVTVTSAKGTYSKKIVKN